MAERTRALFGEQGTTAVPIPTAHSLTILTILIAIGGFGGEERVASGVPPLKDQ